MPSSATLLQYSAPNQLILQDTYRQTHTADWSTIVNNGCACRHLSAHVLSDAVKHNHSSKWCCSQPTLQGTQEQCALLHRCCACVHCCKEAVHVCTVVRRHGTNRGTWRLPAVHAPAATSAGGKFRYSLSAQCSTPQQRSTYCTRSLTCQPQVHCSPLVLSRVTANAQQCHPVA
jgi:hypothetical protein